MNKLIDLPIDKLLSCLSLIEKHIPRREKFIQYQTTIDFFPWDIISLQDEAKRMMKFVGLDDYTAIVSYVRDDNERGGSINLNDDKVVFIEINENLKKRSNAIQAVSCVLGHEICHKLLYTHGLYLTDTEKNEICTDLCTIYVGFSLLTINGCRDEYKKETVNYHYDKTEKITETTVHSLGYLTPKTYIQAYLIIGSTYGLDTKSLMSGISKDMQRFVIEPKLLDSLSYAETKESFLKASKEVAALRRSIAILQHHLSGLDEKAVGALRYLDNRYSPLLEEGGIDRYPLSKLYVENKTDEGLKLCDSDLTKELHSIFKVLHAFDEKGEDRSFLLQSKCPFCGEPFKLPKAMIATITCRKCGKRFVWDATTDNIKQRGLFDKIKNRLKKK